MTNDMSTCPWCGSTNTGYTAQHTEEAIFENSPKTPEAIRKNPKICLDCYHVGGYEDFFDVEVT